MRRRMLSLSFHCKFKFFPPFFVTHTVSLRFFISVPSSHGLLLLLQVPSSTMVTPSLSSTPTRFDYALHNNSHPGRVRFRLGRHPNRAIAVIYPDFENSKFSISRMRRDLMLLRSHPHIPSV